MSFLLSSSPSHSPSYSKHSLNQHAQPLPLTTPHAPPLPISNSNRTNVWNQTRPGHGAAFAAFNHPIFALGARVKLSVTAVSNASGPITIYTWTNIFYPRLSQERGSLVEADRDTLEERRLHIIDVNRMEAINFTLGGPEDELFVTL